MKTYLTDEEKVRIIEEEKLRAKVREEEERDYTGAVIFIVLFGAFAALLLMNPN